MAPCVTEDDVRAALRVVIDPDLHEDIVSLGFVTSITLDGSAVAVVIRLTTPACPAKDDLARAARAALSALPGVERVEVEMTAETRGTRIVDDRMAAALGGVRNLVVIGAGKGGVGKSTVAVNLASALARAGARVGLLDADIHGPSVSHLTGALPPQPSPGQLTQPARVDGMAVVSMAMFLPSHRATILRGPRVTGVLQQLLTTFAWGELDYLLIDLPPGTGDIPITLAQLVPIAGAVLVTTPQEVAVIDGRRAGHMFRTLRVPVLGVVETMSGFVCDGCDRVHHLFGQGGGARLAAELEVPLLGQIPLDPAIVADSERGVAVVRAHPDAPGARALTLAAGRLAAALATTGSQDAPIQIDTPWSPGLRVGRFGDGDAPAPEGQARAVPSAPVVMGVRATDPRTLELTWTDGVTVAWDAVALRRGCPCAACVDERTGVRTLRPEQVGDDVRLVHLQTVGRYALSIRFSDGHDTGLYSWERLRNPPQGD